MVGNNPVTFYDSDGKALVKYMDENYKLGDLIYGLSEPRRKHVQEMELHLKQLRRFKTERAPPHLTRPDFYYMIIDVNNELLARTITSQSGIKNSPFFSWNISSEEVAKR